MKIFRKNSKKGKLIEGVFFSKTKKTLSLKEKKLRLEFGANDARRIWTRYKNRFVPVVISLVFLTGIIGYFMVGNAEMANFYPSKCLGAWQNSEKAQGMPETQNISAIDETNSAVFNNGAGEIFCGGFAGEMPEGKIKNISVKFNWLITNQKKEIKIILPAEENEETTSDLLTKILDVAPEKEVEFTVPIPTANSTEANSENLNNIKIDDNASVSSTKLEESNPGNQIIPLEQESVFDQVPDNKIQIPDSEMKNSTSSTLAPNLLFSFLKLFSPIVSAQESEQEINITETPSSSPPSLNETIENTTKEINTASGTPAEESFALSKSPANNFFVISYTTDGIKWQTLSEINEENWKNLTLQIPVSEWQDISKIQVKIEPLLSADSLPYIYLDGLIIEVEYEKFALFESPDPLPRPDFSKDTIIYEKKSEDIRAVEIERPGNQNPEIWFSISTSTNEKTEDVYWGKIDTKETINRNSAIDLKFNNIFWMDKENRAIWSFNIGTGGYNSVSINPGEPPASLPFVDSAGALWLARFEPQLKTFIFEEAPSAPDVIQPE